MRKWLSRPCRPSPTRKPDLLLLDVQMPKLDGFEVLELVERDVAVVFVTAHDQYALKAFEVHAVDYLLKPFGPERLTEALQRARARLAQKPPAAEPLACAYKAAVVLSRACSSATARPFTSSRSARSITPKRKTITSRSMRNGALF